MRRPDSDAMVDYYAQELLGNNNKDEDFYRILLDAERSEEISSKRIFEILDVIIRWKSTPHITGTLKTIIGDVEQTLRSFIEEKTPATQQDLVHIMAFLTQQQRLILKEYESPDISQALHLIWQFAVVLLEKTFEVTNLEVEKAYQTLTEQAKVEETRISKSLNSTIVEWQGKLSKSQEELKRQTALLDHLKSEKRTLMELLRDREDEILQLKLPPNLKDFDKLLEDMSGYLEEAEGRQGSQAQILEMISVMLDTSRVRSNRKQTRDCHAVGKSPSLVFQRQLTLPANPGFQRSPTKLQAGEKAFFRMMTSDSEVMEPDDPILRVSAPTTRRSPHLSPRANPEIQDALQEEDSYNISSGESEEFQPRTCNESAQTDLSGLPDSDPSFQSKRNFHSQSLNPLIRELELVPKRQSPMSENTTLRFIEQAMEEKFRLDVFREEEKQAYDSLSDFLLSFIYTQSGLRSVVWKTLSSLMSGLERLATANHLYGRLMCRLLGIYDCGSVPLELEVFLSKAQAGFVRILAPHLKHNGEEGGSALYVEVADLLGLLFPNRGESAARVLAACCPPDLSQVDMSCLLICGKLGKLGRDLKYFFVQIDTEKTGAVTFSAFGKGVRETLDLALSQEKLQSLWDSFASEKLTFHKLSEINFKDYASKADSKIALVSRYQLLMAIIHEYEFLQSCENRRLETIFQTHDINQDGILTLDEFQQLVKSLDPHVPAPTVVLMFQKALERGAQEGRSVDSMAPETFCRIAIERKLGGAGDFGMDLKLENCPPMLKELLQRDFDMSNSRNVMKRKMKKPA